ncbi:putative N-ethylmaleimide reductase [Ilyonectria robusta]|uniref:putative N-ethylmaleimide reductase n=1 Tax=Ilyonectria robusta TaxID=1079257 RepID=UPI001E8CA905|nr:putative N-ethylmaleimide reductase [Ilyonectria robusta]KAH8685061.1 putative N-ethylmaleimide reductase [Ilyonectria robusta]
MGQSRLFSPLTVGNMKLTHRIGLCPLTRYRASDEHVPLDMMVDYYAQRSSAPGTLLVTEGTFISVEDGGYANAPGIYNQEQIDMWRKITDAVHANGSYIFCQLWALGRAADAEVTKREGTTISSSDAVAIDSNSPTPERLSVAQIQSRIQNYVTAALNAVEAGFDGVELHGANGYLIDQFIQDTCNKRQDIYGGSIENRSRFAVEVTKAVCEAIGPEKTGIRLSPWSIFNGMRMDDPIPQFSDVIRQLSTLNMAYLHLVESRIAGAADVEASDKLEFAYGLWDGPILVAGGLKPSTARELLDQEYPEKNIVAMFGRYFLSTPDLPFRVEKGLELNSYKRETFYTPKSVVGYLDYPFSKEYPLKN